MKPAPPVMRAFTSASVLESVEVLGDGREIRVAQSCVQRQRQYFIAGLDRPRAVRRAGECERWLSGHRHRVVHERLDAVRLEMTLERVASFRAAVTIGFDDEQMIDVSRIDGWRHRDPR